jgi:hypothetical protein
MRNTILIAAIAILSTNAYAGPSRGLSLATKEDPTLQSTQRTDVAAPAAAVEPTPSAPTFAAAPVEANRPTERAKPKKQHMMTEVRVIYELHRRGIYW